MKEQIPSQNPKPEDVLLRILRAAMAIPGAKIDRAAFLKRSLSKHVAADVVECAIERSPSAAGIPKETVRRLAVGSIKWHRAGVTAISFAAGLPGGWWMAAAVPADLAQFFWHVVVILQKLAYLYGWPELFSDQDEPDDETLHLLVIFIGVMFGAESAGKVLAELGERVSTEVLKRLPREALTKFALYRFAREIAKWIGVKLTKEGFARFLSKLVPILGGFISGTITWISFTAMTNRLSTHLESLPLAGDE